jgi:hypothetical protein
VRPDNTTKVPEIFRVNTCLWGGVYNPIIPYFKRVPDWWDRNGHPIETARQIVDGYLDFFEPDIIVETERGIADDFGFHKKRVIQLSEVLEREGNREARGYGLSVADLYETLYKEQFQFQRRHKHSIVNVKAEDKLFAAFSACVFGAFPSPRTTKYFEKNYEYVFAPEHIALNGPAYLKLHRSGCTPPLHIGCLKLDVQSNSRSDPTLFVVNALEPKDLVDFWNLRAIHQNVRAIPIQWLKELSPFCKQFIKRNYRPLPGNSNGVMILPTVMFSRSIPTANIEILFKTHFQTESASAGLQAWYPPIWRPSPEHMVRTTRPHIEADKKNEEVLISRDKFNVRFDSLDPDFASKYGGDFRWANVVTIQDNCSEGQVATVFPCDYRNPSSPRFRIGEHSLLPTTEGLVFFPQYKDFSEYWTLADGPTAINSWFQSKNISASFSDAGRSTQQIIQTLGGFLGVSKIAHSGIVQLLNEMSRRPISRCTHQQEFKNKIAAAVVKDPWRGKTFETLVNQKAVQLGLELKCGKCGSWSWHPVNQLDYEMNCDLCLKAFSFPVKNPSRSDSAHWAYRVIGPFALPDYAKGGYSAALSIRFFASVLGSHHSSAISWSSGQELELPGGKESEADFIIWYQRKRMFENDYPTQVIFGESKSFGENAFKEKDIERMKQLATTFPGAILVFATLKESTELSKAEIKLIKRVATWGREHDHERRQQRAHIIVLTGTELFAAHSLELTWKEKGGVHAQLVQHPTVNVKNLENLADFTQQLYLGLPSYHSVLEKRWRKESARGSNRRDGATPDGHS